MDSEEPSLEVKCENIMNIVVESRKRFGKMCVDYEQKSSLMERKILDLQLESLSNLKLKPKNPIPAIKDEYSQKIEDFSNELVEMSRRVENLKKKLKCTQEVVCQLKADSVGRRLREPVEADVMLAKVKRALATSK